jgi:membrane protein
MATPGSPDERGGPGKPTDLPRRAWLAVLARSVREFRDDNLIDRAAALTYYAVLAVFPALIVLVALVGIFGSYPETTNALLKIVGRLGPRSAVDTLRAPIRSIVRNKGGAGALLGVGLLGSLWSASGYVGAFMRASNAIYEVEEGRRFWRLRPLQLAVTFVMVLLTAVVALAVVATGPLARAVGDSVGVGPTAVTVWDYAKWPVLLLVVVTMFAVLYAAAPNVQLPGFRWLTPGGVVALALWLAASLGFAAYATFFGSYNQVYGTLGAVVVFLVWLWITNLSILLGAEFNAELERGRQLAAGVPDARRRLQVTPRQRPRRPAPRQHVWVGGRRAGRQSDGGTGWGGGGPT